MMTRRFKLKPNDYSVVHVSDVEPSYDVYYKGVRETSAIRVSLMQFVPDLTVIEVFESKVGDRIILVDGKCVYGTIIRETKDK